MHYGIVMFAVCLGFIWFRLAAARRADNAVAGARQRTEAAITLFFSGFFVGGSVAAFYAPRAALFLYAAVPVTRLAYRGIRGN